jgi:integrase
VWDVESATGKGVLYVGHSKNETSKRKLPLNGAAREAITRMLKRAHELGHTDPEHYLWCASQHHHYDPAKPAKQWGAAWRSLRVAAGLPGFRFHDLRHHAESRIMPTSRTMSGTDAGDLVRSSQRRAA